jgi:predicted Zn-dependent protease
MKIKTLSGASLLILSALANAGCANQNFRDITSTVLGQTGYVSASQAESLLRAGEGVVQAATPLTEEQEYYLGRGVAAAILGRYKPLKNDAVQRYVNVVGRTVAAFSDRPDTFKGYRFLVLDSNEVNAMAAPSGFIFITRGLLRNLKTEDELAGVLAHEVAHVVHADGVNAISSSKLTKAVALVGQEVLASQGPAELAEITNLFSESVNEVVETLVTNGYSRSQEYDADEYARELLLRAGYDPDALARSLQTLENVSASAQGLGGWYSTHPSPKKRREELEEETSKSPTASIGLGTRTARFKNGVSGLK